MTEHTLSTPSSCSQPNSTRSSISHPIHLNLSSTTSSSVSPTKKTTFFIHGSCTPSPRISFTAGTSTAIQPAFIIEEELEESEPEESEEEGILRRQQEEQAAIEALEAYFAYRKASTSASISSSFSNCKRNSLIRSSTSSSDDSSKDEAKDKLIIKNTRSSSDSGIALPEETDITTLRAIPHSSPYFEKYANEPLYTLTTPREDQSAQSTSRPALMSRRSEGSLKRAAAASFPKANGITGQKRRPSLANGLMPIQVRPRGYTYSASPCSGTSSHTRSPIPSPSIPSTSSLNRDQILQVSTLPHSPASNTSLSPSIYAVSIPSSPPTPSQHSHGQSSTVNTQIVSYTRGTPNSSSFLNFGDSPHQSPQFRNGSMKKGASMREYELIPSPPRSSSLQYALSNGGMQEAQSQALDMAVTRKMAKEEEEQKQQATSPTSMALASPASPSLIAAYQERLENYRFPDYSVSRGRSKSSSSAIRTPSSEEKREEQKQEQDRVTTTAPPRIYNPLGQATASRRGSLVSGCLPISQNRNRAGSLASTTTSTTVARDGSSTSSKGAVYDYI